MGRATRWLKNILGMKKPHQPDKNDTENGRREKMGTEKKKRWSFRNKQSAQNEPNWLRDYNNEVEDEHSKHAMAVAAATAAAADAAAAAAQAAVEVVRLTAQHNRDAMLSGRREKLAWAAVKIQTLFRGYLARKALRALKALVKLQAHVRGYLVRKRAAATLHSMQALVRAQAAVRSRRADQTPKKSIKPPSEFRPRRSTGRLLDETGSEFHSKRIPSSSTLSYDQPNNANEGSPKIVEVDTCKPRSRSRRINPSLYDFTTEDFLQYPTISSPLPCPTLTRLAIPDPRNFHNHHHHQDYDYFYRDEYRPSTAQSTPWFGYSNRISGLETPTKSVCGESFFGPYCSNYPNYMAETHSFRAKLRALSAPKQRPDARSRKKLTLNEMLAARNSISGVRMHRSGPQVQEALNF